MASGACQGAAIRPAPLPPGVPRIPMRPGGPVMKLSLDSRTVLPVDRRMWTRIKTIVDGRSEANDWTICRNGVPVGRICLAPRKPGAEPWLWTVWTDPPTTGQAWTELAALNAIKENAARIEAQPA